MSNLYVLGKIIDSQKPKYNGSHNQESNNKGYSDSSGSLYTFDEIFQDDANNWRLYSCIENIGMVDSDLDQVMGKVQTSMEEYVKEVTNYFEKNVKDIEQQINQIISKENLIRNEFNEKHKGEGINLSSLNVIYYMDGMEFVFSNSEVFRSLDSNSLIKYDNVIIPTIETDIQQQKELIKKLTKSKFILKISKKRQKKLEEAEKRLSFLEKRNLQANALRKVKDLHSEVKQDVADYMKISRELSDKRLELYKVYDSKKLEFENALRTGVVNGKNYTLEAFEFALNNLTPEEKQLFEKAPEVIYEKLSTQSNENITEMVKHVEGQDSKDVAYYVTNYIFKEVVDYIKEKQIEASENQTSTTQDELTQ